MQKLRVCLQERIMIAKCPDCSSIWVCWNWLHPGANRQAYEAANPHRDPSTLEDWGHECWKCEGVFMTFNKVRNGMPYWILKKLGRYLT